MPSLLCRQPPDHIGTLELQPAALSPITKQPAPRSRQPQRTFRAPPHEVHPARRDDSKTSPATGAAPKRGTPARQLLASLLRFPVGLEGAFLRHIRRTGYTPMERRGRNVNERWRCNPRTDTLARLVRLGSVDRSLDSPDHGRWSMDRDDQTLLVIGPPGQNERSVR